MPNKSLLHCLDFKDTVIKSTIPKELLRDKEVSLMFTHH